MKGVLILIDGVADTGCKQLGGKTPLEIANKPNLDSISRKSELAYMYSVKEKFVPESDKAVLSILGNDVSESLRGQLEALGADIKLQRGDLALRTNFATVASLPEAKVIDRRAGRTLTSVEAEILAKAINDKVKLPCKFIFKNTIQHRGVLVLKGGFSDNITNTDSAYHAAGKFVLAEKFKFSEPLDEEENSKYTANVVNEFVEQSYKILNEHPINLARRKKGLLPANIILTRDAGIEIPKIKKFKKWAAIAYMPLEIGIAKASDMKVFSFNYPNFKNHDVYQNLHDGLKSAAQFAINTLKKQAKNYDYFYIHFKETDVPGHDNKPFEKVAMIEELDRQFFSYIVNLLGKRKIRIVVTADHATPCNLKSHSADIIPVLIYNGKEDGKSFTENEAKKGKKIYGKELLDFAGFK